MKKITYVFLSILFVFGIVSCGKDEKKVTKGESNVIEKLNIAFVPSRDPEEIVTATEPLKGILQKELAKQGYEVKKVNITVGTNYIAVGEGLSAGSIDVGFIPGGTYALFDDAADVILTATRKGLSVDSEDPKVWNDNKPTKNSDKQVTFYRSIFIAGPSEKGKALAEKVNKGEALTFDDLKSASISVMGTSSSSGYIYPYLWLEKNYGKGINDLTHVVQADSYASSMARLASEQIDLMVIYADGRLDYQENWITSFGRNKTIWEETNIIGVSSPIYNDTISVSKNSKIMTDKLKEALINSFINIGESEEGKKIIKIYNHDGYQRAKDSDYNDEREAQKLIKKIKQSK